MGAPGLVGNLWAEAAETLGAQKGPWAYILVQATGQPGVSGRRLGTLASDAARRTLRHYRASAGGAGLLLGALKVY